MLEPLSIWMITGFPAHGYTRGMLGIAWVQRAVGLRPDSLRTA
jgi:hypothetical protein